MPKLKRSEKGFTIAELTIASAIFSVVILTAVGGFLQMGRIFYKGVTLTSTQETANQIYQDIGGYFQTAATVSPILHTQPLPPATPSPTKKSMLPPRQTTLQPLPATLEF
jgi:prepilin-type N-terminal cleavage/methylation domain-containing protein